MLGQETERWDLRRGDGNRRRRDGREKGIGEGEKGCEKRRWGSPECKDGEMGRWGGSRAGWARDESKRDKMPARCGAASKSPRDETSY